MVNKAIIIGHLGRDPEVRYTGSGKAVCNFSVATSEGPRDNERTEWHRIVTWDKTAEMCGQYLRKGRQVYVEGRIQTREWEKDGEKRYSTEIVAHRVQFLGGRGDDGERVDARTDANHGPHNDPHGRKPVRGYGHQGGYSQPQVKPDAVPYADDDDIPF